MTARPWLPRGRSHRFSNRGSELALFCARNIYALTNRKSPEAVALADWLSQHVMAFGLSEDAVPDLIGPSRLRGVNPSDWTMLGKALAQATSGTASKGTTASERWIAAIGAQLGLDALEMQILSLAVHYEFDHQIERLLNSLSESRCGSIGLRRDAGLIGTLLGAEDSAVAARLMGVSRLFTSGLLHFGAADLMGTAAASLGDPPRLDPSP